MMDFGSTDKKRIAGGIGAGLIGGGALLHGAIHNGFAPKILGTDERVGLAIAGAGALMATPFMADRFSRDFDRTAKSEERTNRSVAALAAIPAIGIPATLMKTRQLEKDLQKSYEPMIRATKHQLSDEGFDAALTAAREINMNNGGDLLQKRILNQLEAAKPMADMIEAERAFNMAKIGSLRNKLLGTAVVVPTLIAGAYLLNRKRKEQDMTSSF